jgi:peptide/nickel transport system substrate-binding protein
MIDPSREPSGGDERPGVSMAPRITRRRLLETSAAAATVFALPSLAGCGGSGQAQSTTVSGRPRAGGSATLALSDGAPGDTVNPFATVDNNEFVTAWMLYEGLFQQNGQHQTLPGLALDATPITKDATMWHVKLRRGVEFHDGRPFTAADVVYSYNYVLDQTNKANQRSSIDAIKPGGIRQKSASEVVFELSRPIGDFATYLAGSNPPFIVPQGASSFDHAANGTGPFKLTSFSAGTRTQFTRNEHYWADVYLQSLSIVPIPNGTQRMNALLTGAVDAVYLVDFTQYKLNLANPQVHFIPEPNSSFVPITIQIDAPQFRDNRVRQALKLSLNRPELVQDAQDGVGTVGNDVGGLGFPSYNTNLGQHEYDPEKAKALLTAAGSPSLTLTLPTSAAAPAMLESATAWKAQAKPAGINVVLDEIPAASYFTNSKYLKVPVYQSDWLGYSFEQWATQALLQNAPFNETHWFNPAWDAGFRAAQGTTDAKKRAASYDDLQATIWADGGYLIWGFQPLLNAVSSHINGAKPWSVMNIRPQDWWIA